MAPKEERYAVQETTEDVQLGTDAKTTEKGLRLHKFSRAPGGKKVTSRVVATFFSTEALARYLNEKKIPKEAVTFAQPPAPAK